MFFVLLLLAFVHGVTSLSCVDPAYSFRTSQKNFDWNIFSSQVIEPEFQPEPWNDDNACRVTISIGYNTQEEDYVHVTYGSFVNDTCDYMEFRTSITLENDQQSTISHIDYVCSSHDFCEHKFVSQWIKRLLGTINNPLHTAITYLLSNSSQSAKCDWKNATSECKSHMCFALYEELKNIPLKNDSCRENRSAGTIYIYVKTKLIESVQVIPMEFDYKCKKNRFTQELSYEFMDHLHINENKQSVSCAQQSFTSTPANLRSENFSLTLNELSGKIKSLLDNIDRCDIYIEADYRQHEGHITVNYDEPKDTTDRYMRFDMILSSEDSTPSIWSRMYYTCLPPHSCDRKLVTKWIRWLNDINSENLQLESKVSLEQGVQSYDCNIWSHALENSVDVCFSYKYKRIESTNFGYESSVDHSSKDTSNAESPKPPCTRFEHKKVPVYKQVISEIPQRCTPKRSLVKSQVLSSTTSEPPSKDQNNGPIEVKSLKLNPKIISDDIIQSTTMITGSSTTTRVESLNDPIST